MRIDELFKTELKVINIGLKSFSDSLRDVGCRVIHVDWRPPAALRPEIRAALEKLRK